MRLFGLIGYPLGHSFSKKYFTEKFERERLPCAFENFPIKDIALLPGILKEHPSLEGLCVTIPYKQQVIPFLNELSPEVREIGACNSIRIRRGILTGYNPDTIGFKQSLLSKLTPKHTRALVLGTGGASRAVRFVLKELGIPYTLVSRRPGEDCISYASVNKEIISAHLLIINTTPLGTFPDIHDCPALPYEFIGPNHFLFDLIYNPEETSFLKKGAQQGAITQNGHEMLIGQAEASWDLWNRES